MKNIIRNMLLTSLSILTINTYAQESNTKHYISISHDIADYTSWKAEFDKHISARQEAGIKDIFVKKEISKTHSITFFCEATNLEKAKSFVSSPELKEAMSKAGVTSAPEIVFYKSAAELKAIDTSAFVTTVSHPVKDFSAWKEVYDSANEMRQKAGINDHLLLRSLSNDKIVTVLGSSASALKFDEFMANPDLKDAMKRAGVISKPEVVVLF